jgi:hypothetical protein
MAKAGYIVPTLTSVALAAATAKTVVAVIAPTQYGIDLKKFKLAFDGVTGTAVPVLWELMTCDLTSNVTPGTGNTTSPPKQIYGRANTVGFTGFYGSTSEPTVLTLVDQGLLTPAGGVLMYDYPLGDTLDFQHATGLVLRCTAPAIVNVRATITFERV